MAKQPGVWFPRPETANDISVVASDSRFTPELLFAILHAPEASELRDKVGVMSPGDGSAKVTTRLLKSGSWLLKTDDAQRGDTPEPLLARIEQAQESARRTRLWHPLKDWLLLRRDRWWWPVSICPWLKTLRQVHDPTERMIGWSNVLKKGLESSKNHRVGLDLNPSNFGREDTDSEWYYLDDEVYPPLTLQDAAEYIAARIPEEPNRATSDWMWWGHQLQSILSPHCDDIHDWLRFIDGLRDYPLTRVFEPNREAVIAGLSKENEVLNRSAQRRTAEAIRKPDPITHLRDNNLRHTPAIPHRTCIFADVHGNKPALDAVLQACRELGVDSYLFLGDAVGYGPFPRECIETLANLPNAVLIRGNQDDSAASGIPDESMNRHAREAIQWTIARLRDTDREWLRSLPVEHREANWLAVHGAPCCPRRFHAYVYELTYEANLNLLSREGPPVCFYGHSHVPFAHVQSPEGIQKLVPSSLKLFVPNQIALINPGSVGQPRDGDSRAAFAVWDRRSNLVTFCRREYPLDEVIREIRKVGLAEDLAYRLELGR